MNFAQVKGITIPQGAVKLLSQGQITLWKKRGGVLPADYRELIGIDFDGDFHYETGEKLYGSDVITITLDNTSTTGQNVFGSYNGTASGRKNFSLFVYGNGSSSYSYLRYGESLYRPKYGTGKRTLVFGGNGTTDGFTTDVNITPDTFVTDVQAFIGWLPNSTSPHYTGDIVGRITAGNRLIWIPVERVSDGEIGYYELNSGVFLTKTGTGTPVSLGYLDDWTFYYANLSLDGSSYINTQVSLFSAANNSKAFELVAKIGSITGGVQYAAAISSMLESNPYPGFVIRRNNDNTTPQAAAGGNFSFAIGDEVKIRRYDEGLMELLINDTLANRFVVTNQFDTPVTIGAGLDASNNPWRYFVGTLGKAALRMTPMPVSATPDFQLLNYVFDGSANTAINTGYSLCGSSYTNWVAYAKISSISYDESYDAMIACFREQSPYAGFYFRRNNNTSQAQVAGIGSGASFSADTYEVTFIRLGSNLYYRVNGVWGTGSVNSHDWPLILGGRLESNQQIGHCTAFTMEEFKLYLL